LSQLDLKLTSILQQIKNNLTELDHPIQMIVMKFQEIMIKNLYERKEQFQNNTKRRQFTTVK